MSTSKKKKGTDVFLVIAGIAFGAAGLGSLWMMSRDDAPEAGERRTGEGEDGRSPSGGGWRARRVGRSALPPELDEPVEALQAGAEIAAQLTEEEAQRLAESQARRREAQERVMHETGRTPEGFDVPQGGFVMQEAEEE